MKDNKTEATPDSSEKEISPVKTGYSPVNGLNLYYEIYGTGKPLVLIHGGGSTIQTTYGRIIPGLSKHRQIIAVEMQAHGHTHDRNAEITFTQDADDIATLLKNLKIENADIMGFSNGGQTTMEIAMRYPGIVNKIIIASAFYKKSAAPIEFWKGMEHAKFSDMPQAYKDAFLKINNDSVALMNMFNRDVHRMQNFTDWTDDQIKAIKAPTLIISSDKDLGSPEHAVEMYRIIPNSQLAILPGGHGSYIGEINTLDPHWSPEPIINLIETFLDK
jgi:pimeloyl-ACP methyl ester carboxylesterase